MIPHRLPADPFDEYGSSYPAYLSRRPESSRQLGTPAGLFGAPPPRLQQQYPRTQQQKRSHDPQRHFALYSESNSGSEFESDGTVTADSSRRAPRGRAGQRSPSEDDDDDDDELYISEEEHEPPSRAPRGQATKGKSKPKASRRQRSPSEVFGDHDELSIDDDEPPARRPAARSPVRQGRCRGRSPSDDEEEEELPAMDPEEKKRLEALKAENGYGKGRDKKKGLH